jgi:MFS family permease
MKRSESGEMRIESFEMEMPNKEKIIDRITENGYFTKYPIYISICIFFTFVANGFIVNIFNLIIIPTQQYFQASDFMTEMMAGIIFIGSAIGSGIAGLLSEKYGRAKVIKIFSGIMCVTYLISTLSFNLVTFFISRIILGLTVGVNEPLIFNTFGEYLPTKIRGFLLMNS